MSPFSGRGSALAIRRVSEMMDELCLVSGSELGNGESGPERGAMKV